MYVCMYLHRLFTHVCAPSLGKCIFPYLQMLAYEHTYIHTYIHTWNLHTSMCSIFQEVHLQRHTYIHTHIHTHTHIYIYRNIYTRGEKIFLCIISYMYYGHIDKCHTCLHPYIYIYKYKYWYIYMHTHVGGTKFLCIICTKDAPQRFTLPQLQCLHVHTYIIHATYTFVYNIYVFTHFHTSSSRMHTCIHTYIHATYLFVRSAHVFTDIHTSSSRISTGRCSSHQLPKLPWRYVCVCVCMYVLAGVYPTNYLNCPEGTYVCVYACMCWRVFIPPTT